MPPFNYTKLFTRTRARPTSTASSSSSQSRKQRFARFWPWLSFSFGALWLVPAILVLSLNFRDVIIGPSVGCLTKKCSLNLHSTNQIQQAQSFQSDDQRAQAGLQLAAKALDAWFCFIAASLVWTILKRLAGQDSSNSLPVGYIHLHEECSDLRVIPKLLWGRRRDAKRMKGPSKTRLYIFIAFLTVLCVLCNLMGPATAVLVIPNLEWVDINNKSPETWFRQVLSISRPLNTSIAPNCQESDLQQGLYSCTFKSYLATTDMIVAAAIATDDQTYLPNETNKIPFASLLLPPVLQEGNVSFTINYTDYTAWIPSRQVLRDLSADLIDYDTMTGNSTKPMPKYPDSGLYTRSLQTRLMHHGPVLGQTNLCFVGSGNGTNWKDFNITSNQTVRCYQRLLTNTTSSWKCVPIGTGWTQFSAVNSQFSIEDLYRNAASPTLDPNTGEQSSNGNMTVTIYTSAASLYIDDTTFTTIGHDFNWTAAFSNSSLPSKTNFTGPGQIFEYKRNIPLLDLTGKITITDFIYCDSQSMLGLADYALNPSALSNPIRLVETNVLTNPDSKTPAPQAIYVHPDWTLAAWSIDVGGTVRGKRGAARKVTQAFENWVAAFASDPHTSDDVQDAQDFRNMHKFMGAQTVSLIPHTVFDTKPKDNFRQPALSRKAMVQVWKYDLNTPSSIFGLVIVLLGVIIVIARTIMYAIEREDMKDATQILVAALQQIPKRGSHSRNDSSTPSLQTPGSTPDMNLLDVEANDYEDDDEEEEEKKKEFPVVYVSPVPTPDVSGGQQLSGTPKRIPYKRRISFHG